jgi:starch phosphorylase
MKFCMNGALLGGTGDGANIEIGEEIGAEQAYIFGLRVKDIDDARKQRFSASYVLDPKLDEALKAIESGMFGNPAEYQPFTESVRNHDNYLIASDFDSYVKTHQKIEADWRNREQWGRRSLLTSIRMGKFSSDRSIIEYSNNIWGLRPCVVPTPVRDTGQKL